MNSLRTLPLVALFFMLPTAHADDWVASTGTGCQVSAPGTAEGATYRWQGEVTTDAELQLLVKTTASRVDDAIARIVALHPYELPECIAVETRAGLPAYLDWIRAQTREDTD